MDRGWTVGWLSSTFVLALSVLILAFPVSAATTPRPVAGQPATESPLTEWAFSGAQVVNQSTIEAGVSVAQAGQFTWSTLVGERSTGPFSLTLMVERGMETDYQYTLCAPSCAAPTYSIRASVVGTEWAAEFLNLSLQTPLGDGGSALGLVNVSAVEASGFNASTQISGSAATSSTQTVISQSAAKFSIGFAPDLAIAPTAPSAGATWTSQSTVQAVSGGWSRTTTTDSSGLPSPDARVATRQNLTPGTAIQVSGSVGPSSPLSTGEPISPVTATSTGPYRLLDGLLVDPVGASLFVPASPGSVQGTAVLENTTSLDDDSSLMGHLGLVASVERFQPYIAAPSGSTPAPVGANVEAMEPPVWNVQALPESVASADAFYTHAGWIQVSQSAAAPSPVPGSHGLSALTVVAVAAIAGIVVAFGIRWRGLPDEDASNGSDRTGPAEPVPERTPAAPEMAPTADPPVRDPFDDLL